MNARLRTSSPLFRCLLAGAALVALAACHRASEPAPAPDAGAATPPTTTGAPASAAAAASAGADATADPANPRPGGDVWVWSPRLRARIGETLSVDYRLPVARRGGEATTPWIGLVPVTVTSSEEAANDAEDVGYEYLPKDADQGSVDLELSHLGTYRIRLLSGAGEKGVLLAETPPVTIEAWPPADAAASAPPRLEIVGAGEPATAAAGSHLTVRYAIPRYPKAWIGVVPASVTSTGEPANDDADVAYEWTHGTAGDADLDLAEVAPGSYVVRLFPCDLEGCDAVVTLPLTIR